jgi:pimeloyl-ACP methyl ester carboxylesterase
MRVELASAVPGVMAPTRILLLPGAYHGPADFVRAGFVEAVRSRELAIDLLLVDPQLVLLNDRAILLQLRTDAVQQARSEGCTSVWLAGISLGGFLAALYAQSFPADLAGLCLLAPYLGNRSITREITDAGTLADWRAQSAGRRDELDEERRIWRFLTGPGPSALPLYLGFGRDDRFAAGLRLLAAQLPAGVVEQVEGGHDWPAWLRLWNNFLDRLTAGTVHTPCQ